VLPLVFKTEGLGRPQDVTLLPFYKVFDKRYTVYWKVYTAAEWEKRKAEIAARAARHKEIESRSLDEVSAGVMQSERDHNYQGERANQGGRFREARDGWFSYELKVAPDKPMTLACTYRGSEGRLRAFDILVDGEKIASQTLEIHPTELFDYEYPIPEALTRGKQHIVVKFQAQAEATAGALIDLRVFQ
jgi:hypothetical protein